MPKPFFTYTCDACGKALCDRIQVMNLALDIVDDLYCLECLAQKEAMPPQAFYDWILTYIHARECFQTPWNQFDPKPCPRMVDQTCFCTV